MLRTPLASLLLSLPTLAAALAPLPNPGMATVLVVRVHFPDLGEPPAQAELDASLAASDAFFRASSFGAFGLASWEFVDVTADVPSTTYLPDDYLGLMAKAFALATAAGKDPNTFDIPICAFPDVGYAFVAWAYRGVGGIWLNGYAYPGAVALSIGNNLGLLPSGTLTGGGYADLHGIMGSATDLVGRELSAYEKLSLGWIGAEEVLAVEASGTYLLYDLRKEIAAGQHYALTFSTGGPLTTWLDFRPTTAPASPSLHFNDAILILSTEHPTPGSATTLLATPHFGTTWTDAALGIFVTPLHTGGTDPDYAEVVVNIGPFPDNSPPTVELSADHGSALIGETVTFTATASDADGDELAFVWSTDGAASPPDPHSATATYRWSAEGTYPVSVTVLDLKGGSTPASVSLAVEPAIPPVVVSAATAAPSPVTGTSAALGVAFADNGGAENLVYTWEAVLAPGDVTFAPNGSGAANVSLATFASAGAHTLRVTARDLTGLEATSEVTVDVLQTPTTVVVDPAIASVKPGAQQDFDAAVLDQFGDPVAGAAVTWSATGGATIDANGTLTAAGVGSVTVTATSGAISGSATVDVSAAAAPESPAGCGCGAAAPSAPLALLAALLIPRRRARGTTAGAEG